jgi:hypothetical protein
MTWSLQKHEGLLLLHLLRKHVEVRHSIILA